MKKTENENGYTLIESLMFIGVVCALGISIINLINNMLDKYRMSRVTQQIKDIQKNIDYRFSAAENFSEIDDGLLTKEKIVPGDMVQGEEIYHAYKGQVLISSDIEGSVYDVTFEDLPYNACIELAMVDWMTGYNSHLLHIKVNNQYFTWQSKDMATKLPMEYTGAMNNCKDSRDNVITWRFQ